MITVNAKIKSTCPTGDFTVTCCIGISNGLRVSSLILFTNICMKNARNYFNTFQFYSFKMQITIWLLLKSNSVWSHH